MYNSKQIEIAKSIVGAGVPEVYYNAETISSNGKTFPAVIIGNEYTSISPQDHRGLYAYIKPAGRAIATTFKLSSCSHDYTVSVPFKIVIFSKEEPDHEILMSRILAACRLNKVEINSFSIDKWSTAKEEVPALKLPMTARTFYASIMVTIKDLIVFNICEPDCDTKDNPITKEFL